MAESLIYTLAAAAVGTIAAFWFCVGSAFMSVATMAELATSYWDYHKARADAVVSQSAQYAVGALLLLTAFIFQVAAAVAPPASQLALPPILSSPYAFLISVLLPVWALSFAIYKLLQRINGGRVHRLLKERTGGK